MSDILIGQSYFLRFDAKRWTAGEPYPPLGSLYAAAYLRHHGYKVSVFDATLARRETDWNSALAREKPRFAILYEDGFNYPAKMYQQQMRQAAFAMIAMARKRGCTVIVCGADATEQAAGYLQAGAHYLLQGEGECTVLELMDRLSGRTSVPLAQIPGIIFAHETRSEPVFTPRRPEIRDLDELPFPALDLVDVKRYRRIWRRGHPHFSLSMVTTRGCPYHCNWCAKPVWGQRFNSRSPENVAAEMEWLRKHFQPDHVWFADDIFGLQPDWLDRFADLVVDKACRIPFTCQSRADLLQRANKIMLLKRAGCRTVWLGAESGSQKILDAMEKGITIEQIQNSARQLREAGIRVGFFIQFGYPGETLEDIKKTFQLVRICRPDEISISLAEPLPGTHFYEAIRAQAAQKPAGNDASDAAPGFQRPYPLAFYRQLERVLGTEFLVRKYRNDFGDLWWERELPSKRHFSRAISLAYMTLVLPFRRLRLKRLEGLPHQNASVPVPLLTREQATMPTRQSEA